MRQPEQRRQWRGSGWLQTCCCRIIYRQSTATLFFWQQKRSDKQSKIYTRNITTYLQETKQHIHRKHTKQHIRLQRWSFFWNDGMVIFFFQGTIAIDGFSMVLPALDHHHWMFFYWSTIDIDGFPMVFPNSGAMVSNGFNLERDLKMRVIVSASIFNSSDQQVLSWIF